MSRTFLDALREPAGAAAGMGRVIHSWARIIADMANVRILATISPSQLSAVFELEESLAWVKAHNPVHGHDDPVQKVAGRTLLRCRTQPSILQKKARGLAYRTFERRARSQIEAALARITTASGRFIYHNPLTSPLPRNLPESCIPVVSVYDIMPFVFRDTYPQKSRDIFSGTLDSVRSHKGHLIVNSGDTKHSLICFFDMDPSHVHVVPLGSDLSVTDQPADLPTGVRQPFALFVAGSNQRRKNLATTSRGFSDFARQTSSAGAGPQLVIVGWGTESFQGEANEIVKDSGASVLCLGAVDEKSLSSLYANAHIGLYTSLYEGFGLPVLECMSRGLPVICGNRTSLPEAAGDAALQVEASEPAEIAMALTQLWNDEELREKLGRAGDARARSMTWQASADKLMSVYAEIGAANK